MLRFVISLFGCTHDNCTFPITAKSGVVSPEGESTKNTYIVCLDCGEEFPYDWQQMKVIAPAKHAA